MYDNIRVHPPPPGTSRRVCVVSPGRWNVFKLFNPSGCAVVFPLFSYCIKCNFLAAITRLSLEPKWTWPRNGTFGNYSLPKAPRRRCLRIFSRRWIFNKYIFNCILLSIDIHNAYICIQNSIGMFQVGVERWFVLTIGAIWKRFSF